MIGSSMHHFFFESYLIIVCITRDAKHILILVSLWKTESLMSHGTYEILVLRNL